MKRHTSIKLLAKTIDELIDHYKKTRKTKRFPDRRLLKPIIKVLFKYYQYLGRGWYKNVYFILSRNGRRELVLKMGNKDAILRDYTDSKKLSNRYFAKIYWHTKYCLLQKYGEKRMISEDILKDLRNRAKNVGLRDVKPDNIRFVDGKFKIIDANF